MPQLVFRFDDGGEEVFSLLEDRIGVGRDAGNRIVIDNDFISAHHARFVRQPDGGYRLLDLNSQSGTYVNDRAIREVRLNHGDRIRFGGYEVGYLDRPHSGRRFARRTESGGGKIGASLPGAESSLDDLIQAKREELDQLGFRVAQMEDLARSLEESLAPVVNPVALMAGDSGGSVIDEVERLEARLEDVRRQLAERRQQLAAIEETQLPEAEGKLAEARQGRDEALTVWKRLRGEIEQAEARKHGFDALEDSYLALESAVEALAKEHLAKKELLQLTGRDLADAEEKLRETRRREEEARRSAEDALRRCEMAEQECREFGGKLAGLTGELQETRDRLAALRLEIANEEELRHRLVGERDELARALRHTQERFRLAEDRAKGVICGWDEFERTRLAEIARRKMDLEEQSAACEARLRKAREELQSVREQIEAEKAEARRSIDELRTRHYEPARQLHQEMLLRSEALAKELDWQQRRLDEVRRRVRDGEETEKLVTHSLERRGQTLEVLEQRIGREVAQIRAEFVSLQRPSTREGPAPVPDFGPIFRTREGPSRPAGRRIQGGSERSRLLVFLPDHGERTWDFRQESELRVQDEPLPLGFAGLAAATGGAVCTSLAMTVESGLPVLFSPAGNLAASLAHWKKLRSAMPRRVILGGWTREAFAALTEELHAGTNFQDLIGVLAMSNGSVTTDPYMNTFFESMNQGKRFLYLAPVFPWNPRSPAPFEGRKGLLVDLRGFEPDQPAHQQVLRELGDWVEESRALITVNEPSRGILRRFQEQLGLGPDWVRVRNSNSYRDWLETLREHVTVLSFEALTFESEGLRDALLSHTPAVGPFSEAIGVFYPELADYEKCRVLPAASVLRRLFEREAHERITRLADKRLLSEHSYQAAAKKLDEFLGSLGR